ncbi:MAG: hypothetical protein ACC645_08560 [Pirellulales bacterium]
MRVVDLVERDDHVETDFDPQIVLGNHLRDEIPYVGIRADDGALDRLAIHGSWWSPLAF